MTTVLEGGVGGGRRKTGPIIKIDSLLENGRVLANREVCAVVICMRVSYVV